MKNIAIIAAITAAAELAVCAMNVDVSASGSARQDRPELHYKASASSSKTSSETGLDSVFVKRTLTN